MRAALLTHILPWVMEEGESKKAAFILMENSHFDRTPRYTRPERSSGQDEKEHSVKYFLQCEATLFSKRTWACLLLISGFFLIGTSSSSSSSGDVEGSSKEGSSSWSLLRTALAWGLMAFSEKPESDLANTLLVELLWLNTFSQNTFLFSFSWTYFHSSSFNFRLKDRF